MGLKTEDLVFGTYVWSKDGRKHIYLGVSPAPHHGTPSEWALVAREPVQMFGGTAEAQAVRLDDFSLTKPKQKVKVERQLWMHKRYAQAMLRHHSIDQGFPLYSTAQGTAVDAEQNVRVNVTFELEVEQ